MTDHAFSLPRVGTVRLTPREKENLLFITRAQLADEALWELFIDAYRTKADAADRGWRGEFWGKTMRGACLTYRCTGDVKLYEILRRSVLNLLACAEEDGRISTYPREAECAGWDIWCRKYVLTGMLHFCDICNEPALTAQILRAMTAHLDALMAKVGPGEGQIPITETSDFWMGVNSCSILEPVMDLYARVPEKRFLDFAEYILSTGGCSGGNLIDLALEGKTPPCEYPETKAYETISFFEGVLAYYEATGEKKYLDAALRFAEAVYETEITLIGCAGCTHELFDHAALRQTEYAETVMQETCVTVTWMRFCARLFLVTGEEKYADRVERSALNALYGSVNFFNEPITVSHDGARLAGLPFDSYSPLFLNRRGREVGGLKYFADGSFYGCCAAIGAAGLAVYPLIRALRPQKSAQNVLTEHRLNGKIAFTFGPYVLARDAAKEPRDISAPIEPLYKDGALCFTPAPCRENEAVRLTLHTARGDVLLTDYASCGKNWNGPKSLITVWMPAGPQA